MKIENISKTNFFLKLVLIVISVILIIYGVKFINKGFDVKEKYYKSDNYSSLNKYVYVGGDAYNYIINANYFTGYIVLGSSLFICSAIILTSGLLISSKKYIIKNE